MSNSLHLTDAQEDANICVQKAIGCPGTTAGFRRFRSFVSAIMIIGCSLIFDSAAIYGQETVKSQAPEPPYLSPVPSHMQWTVTMAPKTQASGQQTSKLHVESIIGYKGEKDIQLTYSWSDGTKTEEYVVNGVVFKSSTPKYPNDVLILDPSATGIQMPKYGKTDFPDLAWLDDRTFVKTTNEGGYQCYLYKITAEQMIPPRDVSGLTPEQKKAQDDALSRIPPLLAWIDVKTRLPVKYDNGRSVMTYKYSADNRKAITPSEAFQKVMIAYSGRMPR